MDKELERLRTIEKKIDRLLKKGGKDRTALFEAFAEAFFIYHNHQLFERGFDYAAKLVDLIEEDGAVTDDLVLAWSNLSVFATHLGDEQLTMSLMAKILNAKAGDSGPESKEAMEARILSANLKIAEGDIHEAIMMLKDNIDEVMKYHEVDSPYVLSSYESLAVVYCNLSLFDMAADLFEKYLELLSASVPDTNPGYIECMRALADIFDLGTDYDSALIYRKERARLLKKVGDRERYQEALIALANTRVMANKELDKSMEELILLQNEIITGTQDEEMLTSTLSTLAEVYLSLKDYEKASDCLYFIYVKTISTFGDSSDEARAIVSRLSYVYSLAEDHEKAIDILRSTYLAVVRRCGRESDEALAVLDELGQAYREGGYTDESIDVYKRLVESRKRSYSEDDLIADAETSLAVCHMDKGEFTEAAHIFQRLIRKETRLYGLDEGTGSLKIGLAECYIQRNSKGDRKRAENELLSALEMLLSVQGPDGELTLKARDLLDSIS